MHTVVQGEPLRSITVRTELYRPNCHRISATLWFFLGFSQQVPGNSARCTKSDIFIHFRCFHSACVFRFFESPKRILREFMTIWCSDCSTMLYCVLLCFAVFTAIEQFKQLVSFNSRHLEVRLAKGSNLKARCWQDTQNTLAISSRSFWIPTLHHYFGRYDVFWGLNLWASTDSHKISILSRGFHYVSLQNLVLSAQCSKQWDSSCSYKGLAAELFELRCYYQGHIRLWEASFAPSHGDSAFVKWWKGHNLLPK